MMMRRLVRRLFTLCSAVSLVLCVAACVLWVRSYRTMDNFGRYAVDPATPWPDRRTQEYLPGHHRRRFDAHLRFVTDEVIPWATRQHRAGGQATYRYHGLSVDR